jgi:hypothetical protein
MDYETISSIILSSLQIAVSHSLLQMSCHTTFTLKRASHNVVVPEKRDPQNMICSFSHQNIPLAFHSQYSIDITLIYFGSFFSDASHIMHPSLCVEINSLTKKSHLLFYFILKSCHTISYTFFTPCQHLVCEAASVHFMASSIQNSLLKSYIHHCQMCPSLFCRHDI